MDLVQSIELTAFEGDRSPPNRRATADWTLDVLLERIFSGELKPGDPLVELDLSAELRVSRSPVREALRQLEHDGLIAISAGNGKRIVARFGVDEIRELYDTRAALEGLALSEAAKVIDEDQLSAMRRIQGLMEEAECAQRPGGVPDLTHDFAFHQLACRVAGRRRLERMLSGLWIQTRALIRQLTLIGAYPGGAEIDEVNRDHHLILQSLADRDPAGARAAVEAHMHGRRDALIKSFEGVEPEVEST